eukprot:768344-Hanusia_phi.AAC.16
MSPTAELAFAIRQGIDSPSPASGYATGYSELFRGECRVTMTRVFRHGVPDACVKVHGVLVQAACELDISRGCEYMDRRQRTSAATV